MVINRSLTDSFEDPWIESVPLYLQLTQRIRTMILSGTLAENDRIPSVREIATVCRVTQVTVSRALKVLLNEGLLFVKRGLGLFVSPGAKDNALLSEQKKFFELEMPRFKRAMKVLNISIDEIVLTTQNS